MTEVRGEYRIVERPDRQLSERELRVLRSFRQLLQTAKCASLTIVKTEDGQIQIFTGQPAGFVKA